MPVIDYFFTALRLRTKSFEIIQTERFSSTFTLYVIFFCTAKSCFSLLLISGSFRVVGGGGVVTRSFFFIFSVRESAW